MTTLYSFSDSVTVDEASSIIIADAHNGARNAHFLIGPPGIAKTAISRYVADTLGYRYHLVNMPTVSPETIYVPVPNHETKTTSLYMNEEWGVHHGEKMVLTVDEMSKGNIPAQNSVHPLIDGLPRRIGNVTLAEGTVVILTGNLPSVGVGDVIRPHTQSRIVYVPIKSPTGIDWIQWGITADMHPYVLATADQYSQWFLSYTDPEFAALDKDDPIRQIVFNPDPANPAKGQPYVCPRTMEFASNAVWAWERSQGTSYAMSHRMLRIALQGCIGVPAAERMMAVIKMGDEVPSAREIMSHAEAKTLPSLRRPSGQPAQMFMALNAPQWLAGASNGLPKPETRVDVQGRITAWFEYMQGGFSVPVMVSFVENLRVAATKPANAGTKVSKLWDVMTSNPTFQKWQTAHLYTY